MKRIWILALVLTLAACGRSQDSTPSAPTPPADAPASAPPANAVAPTAPAPTRIDAARPLNALGAEPFWALQIRPKTLNFSTQESPMRRAANTGPKLDGARASWTAALAGGGALKVTLEIKPCANGVGAGGYPFTAAVETGGKTLKGCATYADGGAEAP